MISRVLRKKLAAVRRLSFRCRTAAAVTVPVSLKLQGKAVLLVRNVGKALNSGLTYAAPGSLATTPHAAYLDVNVDMFIDDSP